ncbi:MAG: PKD domain-containing protein [Nitrospinota bacterium]
MNTVAKKSLQKLLKIACIFIFPSLLACGAAIEPDGTLSAAGSESTEIDSQGNGQNSHGSQTSTQGGSEENSLPIAKAGPDQNVTVNTYLELDGSTSIDPDGDPITYWWELTSSPAGATAVLDSPGTSSPSFTPDVAGVYEFKLTVLDGKEWSLPDIVLVSASIGNSAPVANAGPDRNTTVGSTVTLDGSGSSDFNNDPLSYSWSLFDSPAGSGSTLTTSTTISPHFTPDMEGTYVVELVVHDGLENSAADLVTISVSAGNAKPVADAGASQNTGNYSLVILDGSGSSDDDNDPLTYSWSVVSYPQGSTIPVLSDPLSATPSFTPDTTGTYVFSLTVNDGEVPSTADTVSISVSPLTAILTWTAPTTNADNTPLTDLGGYKISYGTSTGVYTKTKNAGSSATSKTISGLSKTTYYFVIQAYDLNGNESEMSVEVSKTF